MQDGLAFWAHVGDWRLYLIRNGRVVARTRDHSRVQQLVDEGRIREEAVARAPGPQPTAATAWRQMAAAESRHLPPRRVAQDDVILLCSDGFWGPLTQRHIC